MFLSPSVYVIKPLQVGMRRIFRVLLNVALLMGLAFGAQAQNGSSVLVLDVYSVKVPSEELAEAKEDNPKLFGATR